MGKLKISLILLSIIAFFTGASLVSAQGIAPTSSTSAGAGSFMLRPPKEEFFEGRVSQILETKQNPNIPGQYYQKLKLKVGDGPYKDQEVIYDGISMQYFTKRPYELGERVKAALVTDFDGKKNVYIREIVRYPQVYWLAFAFVAVVLVAGRKMGVTALLGLAFTFFVIIYFIIPLIAKGHDPLLVTLPAAVVILLVTICLNQGINRKSLIAITGTTLGVALVGILAIFSTHFLRLTGYSNEDSLFLNTLAQNFNPVNFMLAGMVIGALGILDDIAVTQASTIQELKNANPKLSRRELYRRGMKIGRDHNASMINTLFLAYTGTSFSLLMLLSFRQPPFDTFQGIINNESFATEIARTLVGSIGIVLTIPITTLIAVKMVRKQEKNLNESGFLKPIRETFKKRLSRLVPKREDSL